MVAADRYAARVASLAVNVQRGLALMEENDPMLAAPIPTRNAHALAMAAYQKKLA